MKYKNTAFLEDYTHDGARTFFESVREARLDLNRLEEATEKMESRAYALGGGGTGERVQATPTDPTKTAAVDALIDYRAIAAERAAEDRALVEFAAQVIYGKDGEGGVIKLSRPIECDAVYLRCCEGLPWDDVATAVNMSRRWCIQARDKICDIIDTVGFGAALAGQGVATD